MTASWVEEETLAASAEWAAVDFVEPLRPLVWLVERFPVAAVVVMGMIPVVAVAWLEAPYGEASFSRVRYPMAAVR